MTNPSDQPGPKDHYPEHEKMKRIQAESQAIGAFIENAGFGLCKPDKQGWHPVTRSIEEILADYFEIDLDIIEAEKRDMLYKMRKANIR